METTPMYGVPQAAPAYGKYTVAALGLVVAVATVATVIPATASSTTLNTVAPVATRVERGAFVTIPSARQMPLGSYGAATANRVETRGVQSQLQTPVVLSGHSATPFVSTATIYAAVAGILGAAFFALGRFSQQPAVAMYATTSETEAAPAPPAFDIKKMPGVVAPTGFFDPAGMATTAENKIMYLREAELKHGRVAMLAALGFPLAETFHPLFGGNIDVPSAFAFQQTPLQTFWPLVLLAIGLLEFRTSIGTFKELPGQWEIKEGHKSGDLRFDPLGLKPTNEGELLDRQNRELSNGRLAMIGIVGMVGQELATGTSMFGSSSIAMFATTSETEAAPAPPAFDVKKLPGVVAPTGYFDPAEMGVVQTEAQIKLWREAELKHGRVAMLAALGFPLAEKFHPLFGGNVNVPSAFAFQETPLQTFWPLVLLAVGILEFRSISTYKNLDDGTFELKSDHQSGDLGFDPFGLKPKDAAGLLDRQNRELSNGRLAMIAIVGMIGQELYSRVMLF